MRKPSNIKQNAQLISGVGASSWFTISAEKNLYRIERFSLEGELECSRLFKDFFLHDLSPNNKLFP